ncbi:MAG: S41 family peptidase [Flavobacteriaceae bacterium]|nr:S41 family peptidase [Flavobacteriaceae bacterium]
MKKYNIYFVLFCFVNTLFYACAQKTKTELILDKIIEHAENNSLYRENIDWNVLKKEMFSLAKGADSMAQLKPALDLMLNRLNDTHGRIFYNNQFLSYYIGDKKLHRKNIDSKIYNQIQSGQIYKFKATMLQDSIGYVRIVGLPMGDNQKMSTEIQDAACRINEQGAKKWIIDLRYNGGGNMFPMIEGIATVVGDGFVGGTKGLTDEESSVWKIKDGDFYYDEQTVALKNKCYLTKQPKVAVLLSPYTASSGEALAVILKNRPNTRFFGGKTMGLVTVTDWKQIDSLTMMSISVSYYKDRNNNVYKEYVDVDEKIEFDPDIDIEDDKGINRAIEWLNNEKE